LVTPPSVEVAVVAFQPGGEVSEVFVGDVARVGVLQVADKDGKIVAIQVDRGLAVVARRDAQ